MASQVVRNLILLLFGLFSVVLSIPAGPTGLTASSAVKEWKLHDRITACADVKCKFGLAELDSNRNLCACPPSIGQSVRQHYHFLEKPHPLIALQYKQLEMQINAVQEVLCGLVKTCSPGFEFAIAHRKKGLELNDFCNCVPACDGSLYPHDSTIFSWESDSTLLSDCEQTCPLGKVRQFDKSSGRCSCQWKPWPELIEDLKHNLLINELFRRQYPIPSASPTPTITKAASFTGSPTPLPSGVNTSDPAVASFVLPPDINVTPALIQQSLNQQPQSTANIISVIPYFKDCVIVFGIQLAGGPASGIVTMNASCLIPCGTIGNDPEPGLVVVPQTVNNGTTQLTAQEACMIIALNWYTPEVVTFWVHRPDGALFSVASDNKLHNLDKINTSVPAFADILTTDTPFTKRDWVLPNVKLEPPVELAARGLEDINDYTATMSKGACAAMTCNGNGNPALYNPFQRTCYCQTLEYAEVNPSSDPV